MIDPPIDVKPIDVKPIAGEPVLNKDQAQIFDLELPVASEVRTFVNASPDYLVGFKEGYAEAIAQYRKAIQVLGT